MDRSAARPARHLPALSTKGQGRQLPHRPQKRVYEPAGTTTTAMTEGANGLWTVTLGPFEPNLYEYQFNLDGVLVPDPGNDRPKPQRHVDTSLLLIPGDPPDFLDVQNGAHGTMREETYYSTALGKFARLER